MMRRLALLVFACLASTGAAPFPPGSPIADVTELFPVEPGVNAERGFAVAVAGDWLAMGARLDDEAGEDAGAVYLFQWSGTAWEQRRKLFADPRTDADPPLANTQFGFSVALRDNILAVGAPGQGAVYVFEEVFEESGSEWVQRARWPRAGQAPVAGLGRAVALGDDEDGALAVGAGDGHGKAAGAVYVLRGPAWGPEEEVLLQGAQDGERFGSAVSFAGDTLVVGAPGNDLGPQGVVDAGAAYVFERETDGWRETSLLRAEDSSKLPWVAGSQFGFAVATDGSQIIVGAPTADAAGESSGAVFRFESSGGDWIGGLLVAGVHPGDQLGFSVAVALDIIVLGSPAPPPAAEIGEGPAAYRTEGKSEVRVFRRSGASYLEVAKHESQNTPSNAELRDLEGFAVAVDGAAVDGARVVTGAPLGDQGSGAAGAAWSFRCPPLEDCKEEAEAVARDHGPPPIFYPPSRFGHSIALAELPTGTAADLPSAVIAVGAPRDDPDFGGLVYVFRRAREGWRQETILPSLVPFDRFGVSVALAGPLLAVGAPGTASQNGVVHLFTHSRTGYWSFETSLTPDDPHAGDGFGPPSRSATVSSR